MRPLAPTRKAPAAPPPNCLNCDAVVPSSDRFCGKCGQENEASPVSFAALLREVWEAFVQIDATLLRTLRLLVFRPGFLSAEYVRGRRSAYLSPFKMYLAVSAVYFLLWGLVVPFDRLRDAQEEAARVEAQITADAAAKKPTDKGALPKPPSVKTGEAAAPVASPTPSADSVISFKSGGDPVKFFREYRHKSLSFFGTKIPISEMPETVSRYREAEQKKPVEKRDSPMKHFLMERSILFVNDPTSSARNLFSTALPCQLLIHLPLFAVWMRLIYFRQKRLYVEHLVFLLHTHAFFFLLFGAVLFMNFAAKSFGMVVPFLEYGGTWLLLIAVITGYNLLAFRNFYGQSWGKTLIKGWFLLNGYLFLQLFTIAIAAVVSLIWTLFTAG